jgi:Protein NO VEIN, C-terminal
MARAVRKFDPAARDAANRTLGIAGEDYVVQLERSRLERLGRNDLAAQVRWVAQQLGDGLGYDIESFSDDGSPIYIEVKTMKGSISAPFYISENERRAAVEKGRAFHIYRLFEFGTATKVYRVIAPLNQCWRLSRSHIGWGSLEGRIEHSSAEHQSPRRAISPRVLLLTR